MYKFLPFLFLNTLVACGPGSNFRGESSDGVPYVGEAAGNTVKSGTKNVVGIYDLIVASQDSPDTKKDPVELLFLLDNSASMSDNISKLEDSVGRLLTGLQEKKVPYRARVLTLDLLLDQLQNTNSPSGKAPVDLFTNGAPNYDRTGINSLNGKQYDDLYSDIELFDSADSIDSFKSIMANAIRPGQATIENEPGICLAMDYINWVSNNSRIDDGVRFSSNQKIHLIMLSDEDNAEIYYEYNPYTGDITNGTGAPIYCYKDKITRQSCNRKNFNIYHEWTEFAYTHTPETDEYRHTGTYRGLCHRRDASLGNEIVPIKRLQSNLRCATEQYRCPGTVPSDYSCNLPATAPIIVSSNYEGSISSCSVTKEYGCRTFVDGQVIWDRRSRANALSSMSSGAECSPILAETFTCPDIGVDLNWDEAFEHIYQNGSCTPHNSPQSSEVALINSTNAGRLAAQSCQAFSCSINSYKNITPTQATYINYTQEKKDACTIINEDSNKTWQQFQIATNAANDALTGVTPIACHQYYHTYSEPTATHQISSADFCDSNITANVSLPAGVNAVNTGRTSEIDHVYNFRIVSALSTKAQVANQLGIPEKDHLNGDVITTMNNPALEHVYREVALLGGRYTYQHFPPGAPERTSLIGFKEVETDYHVRDDNSKQPPPIANRLLESDVVTTKIYESSDPQHYEETCTEAVTTDYPYKPTPKDFQALIRELHPRKSVTWHSIVNLDGSSCKDSTETNQAEGKDYKNLSALSGGVVSDICANDFNAFIDKLEDKVLTEVTVSYRIPSSLKGVKIFKVLNKTTGKTLLVKRDYWISGDFINFDKKVITKGDKIKIN